MARICFIGVTLPKRIAKRLFDTGLPLALSINVEESLEVFFALFLMIYLYSIHIRSQDYKAKLDRDELNAV